MTTVNLYYDFQLLQSIDYTSGNDYMNSAFALTPTSGGTIIANVKYKDVNYFATKVYFCNNDQKINNDQFNGFVVMECVDDAKGPDKHLFFCVPLMSGGRTSVDFESYFTTSKVKKIELNRSLNPGDSAKVITNDKYTTVIVSTPVNVQTNSMPDNKISTAHSTAIAGLNLSECYAMSNANATLVQQSIEWEMNCAIVDETETKTTLESPKIDTNDAITLFLVSLMIAGGAYTLAPAVYTALGYDTLNETGAISYQALNQNWGIVLVGAALWCIVTGVTLKQTAYYFMAITLVVTFLAGSQSVQSYLIKMDKKSILAKPGGPLDVFKTIQTFEYTKPQWLSLLLSIIYFCLLASLGSALKSASTFNAMLISFLLTAAGATLFEPFNQLVVFIIIGVAVLMSILYPTLATFL